MKPHQHAQDALELLMHEHVLHRDLLETCTSMEKFPKLKSEIVHHVNIEEVVLYPILLKAKLFESEIRNAWEEHKILMQLLQEMDAEKEEEKFSAKLNALKKILLLHIEEEEKELFPQIRETVPAEFLMVLKNELEKQKLSLSTDEILYPEIPGSHEAPPEF